ncbi:hypothetical protein C3E77_14125 [Mycetocola zhujimingii]|nr:hypothetical protein C3E77_14125 [Mycetocola zhujimingii]
MTTSTIAWRRAVWSTIFGISEALTFAVQLCGNFIVQSYCEGRDPMKPNSITALIMVAIIGGMSVPLALWLARDPARFWTELLGFGPDLASIPWGWLLAVTVAAAYIGYTFWAVPFVRRTAFELNTLKALAVPLAIVTGTLEELIFRKFLMDGLSGIGAAWWVQAAAAALAFGLAHSVWVMFSRDLAIIAPVAISTTVLGGALAIVYLASDRLILPAILAHIIINLVIEPALLRSSLTGLWREAAEAPGNVGGRTVDTAV